MSLPWAEYQDDDHCAWCGRLLQDEDTGQVNTSLGFPKRNWVPICKDNGGCAYRLGLIVGRIDLAHEMFDEPGPAAGKGSKP